MVDGDWFRFDALQDFQLVWLSNFSDSFFRFFSRHLFTTHGKVFADDFVLKYGGGGGRNTVGMVYRDGLVFVRRQQCKGLVRGIGER